jgi:hypothetical protein
MTNLKYFILILFLISCGKLKRQKQSDDPLAARFRLIDSKLRDFASKHNAEVATVWAKFYSHIPDDTGTYAIKRIVWTDSLFVKAIIIQPHLDPTGLDSTAWDLTNVAWLENRKAGEKRSYVKNLLTKVKFEVIEKKIDQFLSQSEKNLQEIKIEDLK